MADVAPRIISIARRRRLAAAAPFTASLYGSRSIYYPLLLYLCSLYAGDMAGRRLLDFISALAATGARPIFVPRCQHSFA